MNTTIKLITQSVIAFVIRLWLMTSEFKNLISSRVEISTPLNSWKGIVEGVHILNGNEDPYMGDFIHEPPLHFFTYKFLINHFQEYLPYFFVLCDVLTAYCLYLTAKKYLTTKLEDEEPIIALGDGDKNKKKSTNKLDPIYVFTVYLFNPYIILNCVAMTTTVFSNLFLALYLLCLVSKQIFLCCATAAISTNHSLYFARLIIPIVMKLNDKRQINKVKVVFLFFSFLVGLQYVSYLLTGNLNYIENTYVFMLFQPDMKPNIGIFWYSLTEVYNSYRLFLIYIFHLHGLLLYIVPLSINLRKDPVFLAGIFIILTPISKFYPCLGDVGFCLSLASIWSFLFRYVRNNFFILCAFVTTTALGPIMWNLWIYSRSANANFFFGVTLSFVITQMFVCAHLIYTYHKRNIFIKKNQARNCDTATGEWTFVE